jgi:two-component system, OmpR family, sensor histidine kinase KdpD
MKMRGMMPYAWSVSLVLVTTLLGELTRDRLEPTNIAMFYLLVVVIAAARWGRGPALVTSVLGVLAFDYFLVPPYRSLTVASIHYIFTFIGLLVVGLVISTLASRMREQTIEARRREALTAALYRLSTNLANATAFEDVLEAIRKDVGDILSSDTVIYMPAAGSIKPISVAPGFPVNDRAIRCAQRAFETAESTRDTEGQPTGRDSRYVPLRAPSGVIGVLGIHFRTTEQRPTRDEENMLNALVNQASIAIQRAKLAEEARQVELMKQTEKLQSALLSSISHDLRTPLASITGTLTALRDQRRELDDSAREELLRTANEESERLNRLVENLLDMTRMEARALRIIKKPCDLRDVIAASLEHLRETIGSRPIRITIPPDIPEVPIDLSFMIKVFTNLIDNALKYSPAESPIEIGAHVSGDEVRIDVTDRGIGIPDNDLKRIFDKFYRAEQPRRASGTGLGLSICKGIVEAHGGTISAANNEDVGAMFTIMLPLQ